MTVEQVQPGRMRLLHRTLHAGSWTLVGYGYGQFLRFAGNLILTRLLFPEAFGAMALVQSVLTGLTLLSDLGISQAIVQNARGHTAAFLNTAWTVQVIRGVLIWVATCALALPVATFYHNQRDRASIARDWAHRFVWRICLNQSGFSQSKSRTCHYYYDRYRHQHDIAGDCDCLRMDDPLHLVVCDQRCRRKRS